MRNTVAPSDSRDFMDLWLFARLGDEFAKRNTGIIVVGYLVRNKNTFIFASVFPKRCTADARKHTGVELFVDQFFSGFLGVGFDIEVGVTRNIVSIRTEELRHKDFLSWVVIKLSARVKTDNGVTARHHIEPE